MVLPLKKFLKYLAVLPLLFSGASTATTVSFGCITNNNSESCAIGEAQLFLEITAGSVSGTDLKFTNVDSGMTVQGNDPNPSVTEIYFDTILFGVTDASITGGSGVSFTLDQTLLDPGDLPGGGMTFNSDFGAEADGNTSTGIQEGDWLTININYALGLLLAALDSGDLAIGMHVRAFEGPGAVDFSEGFVNTSVVPVPAAFWLFGTALIGFIGISRRTKV